MALTADAEVWQKDGRLAAYAVAAGAVIHKGALVCVNASGYLIPAADAAGNVFVGVAAERADNGDGASGALTCRVHKTGSFVVSKASASQADVGDAVYVTADDTVAGTSTNSILAGYVVARESGATVRIRIDNAVR